MLMRTDPFRELDRLTQQFLGNTQGTWSRRRRCRWTPTAWATSLWSRSIARRHRRRDRTRRRAQRADREGRASAHRGDRARRDAGRRAPARCVLAPAVPRRHARLREHLRPLRVRRPDPAHPRWPSGPSPARSRSRTPRPNKKQIERLDPDPRVGPPAPTGVSGERPWPPRRRRSDITTVTTDPELLLMNSKPSSRRTTRRRQAGCSGVRRRAVCRCRWCDPHADRPDPNIAAPERGADGLPTRACPGALRRPAPRQAQSARLMEEREGGLGFAPVDRTSRRPRREQVRAQTRSVPVAASRSSGDIRAHRAPTRPALRGATLG